MVEPKDDKDWREAADRFGNALAQHLERFGTRVQEALESLEETQRPKKGVTIEDHRGGEEGEAVESLRKGDVFDYRGNLYMRLGVVPEARRLDEIDAVNLSTGDVRLFERGTRVEPVDAKVVVKSPPRPGDGG